MKEMTTYNNLNVKVVIGRRIVGYRFNEEWQSFVLELEDGSELRIEEVSQSGGLNITVEQ